ncbi:helix-turn-helix domain-containing protein [Anaerocolumna sedimenticola]|uniref:Helix-turn-helix domain-containing protein n=1 Tax=Anaerocolumna sedimenticola TaxID=2696063 RepID=A0A6P1TGX6_9FIRM|nr:helix-turn-helix transcriptional regulator [Anaerocolumna sedimenticola]QHQ59557.1 helix-turn-helix domain-containing protein [Anaerocolumna sedimenticola]
MFSENLKALRKTKGLSQEELAVRLNVVRQTISKWEKGLSVPDADMLIRIAEVFEVSVSEILGAKIDNENNINIIAEQLSRINEQLAIRNHRWHRIWKMFIIIIGVIIAVNIILAIIGFISYNTLKMDKQTTVTTESEIIGQE